MKKILFKGFVLSALFVCAQGANAQLSGLLDKAKSAISSGSAASDIVSSLIGTATVTTSNISGAWSYSKPAIAFESENLLSQAGGAAAASTIEDKLSSAVSKYGITAGKMILTFKSDGTFTCTVNGKSTSGTYKLSKATITLYTAKLQKKTLSANVKISGSTLQITFKADKLLTFIQGLNTINASSSSLSTVSSLAKNFSGMQIGFKFSKK